MTTIFNPVGMYYNAQAWFWESMASRATQRYTWGYYNDVNRFWSDYYKNTGFKPRYPYKSGSVYDVGQLYSAQARVYRSQAGTFKW